MLQRKQTIWLLLTALCALLTFKYSFFSGNKTAPDNTKQFEYLTATTSVLVFILTIILLSTVAVAIFLYKNRKLQMRLILVDILVSLLIIYMYFRETQKFIEGNYDVTSVLSVAIPVFLVLALMGVYRDEKLLKSMDRLR
jgi:drug/metabolite transporter (DMT)-like permease